MCISILSLSLRYIILASIRERVVDLSNRRQFALCYSLQNSS